MYTTSQIAFLKSLREDTDYCWTDIAKEFNAKFNTKHTKNALRKTYKRYKNEDFDPESEDQTLVKKVKSEFSAKETSKQLRKINKVLTEDQLDFQDIRDAIAEAVKDLKKDLKCIKVKKKKQSKKKQKQTIEPLLSDLHYGLKTKSYSVDILREKMSDYVNFILDQKKRDEAIYDVEKIRVLLNGDIIQSATMHKDSAAGCEMTNAEQIAIAIRSLFWDFFVPLAKEGLPIHVIGTCGNHDREQKERFTTEPGKFYFTYTIYAALEDLCKAAGLKNVTFDIVIEPYHIYESYGFKFLVEHGHDLGKALSLVALEKQLNKRQTQERVILSGIRVGHFHNDISSNNGRYIANSSPVSDDHYAGMLGFASRPGLLVNYYLEGKKTTSFDRTINVDLG